MDHFDLLRTGNRQSPGGNMAQILVVEDDPHFARMLVRFLKDHDVVVVSSAFEWAQFLRGDWRPNGVVSDFNLWEGMSADDLAQKYAELGVPLLLWSGESFDAMSQGACALVAQAIYQKDPDRARQVLSWFIRRYVTDTVK